MEHCSKHWKEFRVSCSDLQVYSKFWSMDCAESNLNSYLEDVKYAVCVVLHIEVADGELNATPRIRVNVPDTLLVGGIRVWVPRTAEGACGS